MQLETSRKLLKASATFWFCLAVVGQIIFIWFIVYKYGGSALQGQAEEVWNKELTHGYVPGETSSNIATVLHLFFATVITLGGLLQLTPQIRNRFPVFHRWNGRIYISTAFIMSLSGLFLIWTTGTVGDWTMSTGQSFNALVIMLCAFQAIKFARASNFVIHRQWAIRLFLVVSGVWFFRVFMMAWFGIHQAPVGLDPETFTGWFVTLLTWGETIISLAIAQLYFHAEDKMASFGKSIVALFLLLVALLMAFGIFMATVGMWFPNLMN